MTVTHVPDATVGAMPLIMDIGMNNGRDSSFYLEKGFRVVAVEANPVLAAKAHASLAAYVDRGQLIIESVGIGSLPAVSVFYENLNNDHWSSFRKDWGTRDGSLYREREVHCILPQELFERHGMPYYLKIDIEGNDIEIVRALHDFRERPRYLSLEEHESYYFEELRAVGGKRFKLVNQNTLWQVRCPNPPREGRYVDAAFDAATSGPFGEEAPGDWVSFDQALSKYHAEIRSPTRGFLAEDAWFDIHVSLE
jgi:FkbM family methyltransferase